MEANEHSPSPVLEVRNLTVRFDGRKVLDNFSLEISSGERVAVTGKSGSGKSTLLKCLMGFKIPDLGEIYIDREKMEEKSVWKLRRLLAYIPQEPELGRGLVSELLAVPFSYKVNRELKHQINSIKELFRKFHLDEKLLEKDISFLSGGEKQRVALISALLLRRPVALMDEATSALDDITRKLVLDYFRKHSDIGILAVTHDQELMNLCGRTVRLGASE